MTNSEALSLLLSLTEENVRLKAALNNLKSKMRYGKERNRKNEILYLDESELNEVLEIGGLREKDIDTSIWDHIIAARED